MVFSLHLPQADLGTMTLRIKRLCEHHRTRICLSGELRCAHLVNLRTEIERFGQPATLDLDEVSVVDIDGIRFLNECQAQGIQVVNCSPYIRQWMLQEKQARRDEE
jgi:ABC-type transporter Mla MlaB component